MIHLALETSSRTPSISLFEDEQEIEFRRISSTLPTTQVLVAKMQTVCQNARLTARDLEMISVATGPGSFTGLRVGVTVAKSLAYALNCPAVGVNTLHVVARDGYCRWRESKDRKTAEAIETFFPVLNAQRGEWFAAEVKQPLEFHHDVQVTIVRPEEFIEQLPANSMLLGPPVAKLSLETMHPASCVVAPEDFGVPSSSHVGLIALQMLADEATCTDPFALTPNYCRLSAAEEKKNMK